MKMTSPVSLPSNPINRCLECHFDKLIVQFGESVTSKAINSPGPVRVYARTQEPA